MASAYPAGLDSFATNKANATATSTDHPAHHNDLADAVNKIEAELGITPSGAYASVAARLGGAGSTPNANDDYFPGTSLDASWTAIDTTGTVTRTVGNSVLSVLYDDQSADDVTAIAKPLSGVAIGDIIETKLKVIGTVVANYQWVGIGFSDGAVAGSSVVMAYCYLDINYANKFGIIHGTFTALPDANAVINRTLPPGTLETGLYVRLVWTASDSFTVQLSLDGNVFSDFGAGAQAKTLTPTHAALIAGTKGGATPGLATFEHFRFIP